MAAPLDSRVVPTTTFVRDPAPGAQRSSRAGRCALALFASAACGLAFAAGPMHQDPAHPDPAQDPARQESARQETAQPPAPDAPRPARPDAPRDAESVHEEMNQLIGQVERSLKRIDANLFTAATGRAPVESAEASIAKLFDRTVKDAHATRDDMLRILELAKSHVHDAGGGT